jgi:cytochrome c-type biogenesis protein CcmH/NrfG
MAGMLPSQKIAWGIVLTLLVITSPVGLWLLFTGLHQLRRPEWRIRMYVHQAALEPQNAAELLGTALAIDPDSPEVLGPLAELRSSHGDDAAALPLYREYCERVPSDWLARGHYAMAAIRSNQVDEAITQLDDIRQHAPVAEDSMASVIAHLAYAYLCKEDPQQALALIDHAATHPSAAAPGAQQCVFYQGICEYMLGRTAVAVARLDRLYAINPAYEGLRAVKDGMVSGTYELLLPDGAALVPVTPGHVTHSAMKVQRAAPRSPHCLDCQAPLAPGAVECPYCHAAVGSITGQPSAPPPPPPTAPPAP